MALKRGRWGCCSSDAGHQQAATQRMHSWMRYLKTLGTVSAAYTGWAVAACCSVCAGVPPVDDVSRLRCSVGACLRCNSLWGCRCAACTSARAPVGVYCSTRTSQEVAPPVRRRDANTFEHSVAVTITCLYMQSQTQDQHLHQLPMLKICVQAVERRHCTFSVT